MEQAPSRSALRSTIILLAWLLVAGLAYFQVPVAWATSPAFAPAVDYPTGSMPSSLVAGDFNGDGHADVAVVNQYDFSIAIFLGNGDGTFTQGVTLAAGWMPAQVVLADFNRDGKLDLAVTNILSSDVSIFLGLGNGDFAPALSVLAGDAPYGLAVTDLDQDGIPDLVVTNASSGATVGETVGVFLGAGDGTFRGPNPTGVGLNPLALAAGDFNGDGHPDIAVAIAQFNTVEILLGDGTGALRSSGSDPVGYFPRALAAADLDRDGSLDLVVANSGFNDIGILRGRGDGTFGAAAYVTVGMSPSAIAIADFDGDGYPDIAVANYFDESVMVLRGLGDGSFQPPIRLNVGAAPSGIIAADLNGDGGTDLIVTNYFANTISVLRNGTEAPAPAPAPAPAMPATLAVVSGDGQSVAVGTAFARPLRVIARDNVGAPVPQVAVQFSAPANGATARFADGTAIALVRTDDVGVATAPSLRANDVAGSYAVLATVGPLQAGFALTNVGLSNQVIAFDLLVDRAHTAPPVNATVSASSGLPVSLVTLTPSICGLAATTIANIGVGTCTVRATQEGNATIGPALPVERSFAVTPGSQIISFDSEADKHLDAPPVRLRATSSSGLPITFGARSPAVCMTNGDWVSLVAVGTCTVRASQSGSALYARAQDVDMSFQVLSAYQEITFWPLSAQSVAESPTTLSATASSGLPVAFSSLTPAVCTVSGNAATLVAVGNCNLRATQAGDGNFSAAAAVERSFAVVSGTVLRDLPARAGPFIAYSGFVGGYGPDRAFDVVVGLDGGPIVGGSVASTNFPGLSSTTYANAGLDSTFVAKLKPEAGVLERAWAVGGRSRQMTGSGSLPYVGPDQVEAMTIDRSGNVYVAAYANSVDFPLRGATYARTGEKFVYRIAPDSSLHVATAPIDAAVQTIRAIVVDATGAVYLTGVAGPGLVTSPNAIIPASRASDGGPYLLKIAPDGRSTLFATYLSLGGSRAAAVATPGQSTIDAKTTAYAMVVDAAGAIYLAGQSGANDFPVNPGSPDTLDTRHRDAFVAKVDPSGTSLAYVARLGGTDAERATSIALAPDGAIVIGGKTATQPFVGSAGTVQSVVAFNGQTPLVDRETGFVAKLSTDGRRWIFVATLGSAGGNLVVGSGNPDPCPIKVAVDSNGAIYAAGTTYSDRSLPIVTNLAGVAPVGAFLLKMSGDGRNLVFATGLGAGIATGLALDGYGNAFVAGYSSRGLPTIGAAMAAPAYDGSFATPFVAKLNDRMSPLEFASQRNPAPAGQPIDLVAVAADARFVGSVEFRNGDEIIGATALVNGIASMQMQLPVGVHRLRAILRDSGPHAGHQSAEVIQLVNQAAPAP